MAENKVFYNGMSYVAVPMESAGRSVPVYTTGAQFGPGERFRDERVSDLCYLSPVTGLYQTAAGEACGTTLDQKLKDDEARLEKIREATAPREFIPFVREQLVPVAQLAPARPRVLDLAPLLKPTPALLQPRGTTPALVPTGAAPARTLAPSAPTINGAPGAPTAASVPPVEQNMNGFSCPADRAACLESIPRDDITILSQLDDKNMTSVINLDDARGMELCSMSGLLAIDVDSNATPAPSQAEQAQYWRTLFFLGTFSVIFRGKDVPGLSDLPLSQIAAEPGCCDAPVLHIGCRVPDVGGLQIKLNMPPGAQPAWLNGVQLAVRTKFSGCGCGRGRGNGGCGCGCGGGGRRGPNPLLVSTNTEITPIDPGTGGD